MGGKHQDLTSDFLIACSNLAKACDWLTVESEWLVTFFLCCGWRLPFLIYFFSFSALPVSWLTSDLSLASLQVTASQCGKDRMRFLSLTPECHRFVISLLKSKLTAVSDFLASVTKRKAIFALKPSVESSEKSGCCKSGAWSELTCFVWYILHQYLKYYSSWFQYFSSVHFQISENTIVSERQIHVNNWNKNYYQFLLDVHF